MARGPEAGERRTRSWSPARVAAAAAPKGLTAPAVFAAVMVVALYFGREILIPIVVAVLLSFVLGALLNVLRRIGLPRLPAVLLSVGTAVGIVAVLSTVIGMQLADLAGQAPRYATTIERKVEGLKEGAVGRIADYLRVIGREVHKAGAPDAAPEKVAPSAPAARPQAPEPQKPVLVEVREAEQSPAQIARTLLSPVVAPLTTAGIVFVVLVFILMQREDLRDRMIRLVGSNDLHRTTVAMDDAAQRLRKYFVFQLALNAAFGVLIGLGLWAIGVPNPMLWGIFSALMRFVPYIGAIVSALLPLALAAAVDPGWTMVILTLALFGVLEPLVGQVIEPLVYGHSTGLSPFAVLVSALFWTWLWGPVGLLLSTPLTVCLVVIGRHVPQLEFLDVLLGDRPALTPVENFYQRILADDPDEAQEQAETMLRECSLSSYYDAVVLKGLRLAAIDAQRGVLTSEQLERIHTAIRDLVAEFADHEDAAPIAARSLSDRLFSRRTPPEETPSGPDPIMVSHLDAEEGPSAGWRVPGAILCVAGRGPLDETAARLLAELLTKHGFGARLVPHAEVSRARLEALDAEAVKMVCVAHLDMIGSLAHLRFLVQRLRRRLRDVPVLVGFWPADDAEERPQVAEVGGDLHVHGLKDAVEACSARACGKPMARADGQLAPAAQ